MTSMTDNTAAAVRNEAQRLFDGFTVDVLHQVVFNQKVWNEITEGHPGRIGRELLVKSKDLPEPVNTSTREAILYAARYFLNGKDMQVSECEYSRRYIGVIRSIAGIDLCYLELREGEDPKLRDYKIEAILRFMTYIMNAAKDRPDINWSYLESEIPPAAEGTVGDIRSIGGIWKSDITIPEKYGLAEFWFRLEIMKESKTDRKLWKAMQEEYKASHSAGSRFEGFEKIRRELLPKGYTQQKEFKAKGRSGDGPVRPLADICSESGMHIAVIGEGGIGKTTFLQQYLKDTYFTEDNRDKEYEDGVQVPVFIELSRCSKNILDWNRQGHTTFVARYLGKLIENHDSLEDVSEDTIEEVERLMQRRSLGGHRTVLLLLDGFNEVTTESDNRIRQALSDEIRYLQNCSNVRIIVTSRDTQAAGYQFYFEKVRLVGLKEEDIREYLKESGISRIRMREIFSNPTLMECLRIPLFLWMFSSRKDVNGFLPENEGEIMYLFFHKDSPIFHTFYSERQRQSETGHLDFRTLVVLDFILPYVANMMYLTSMYVSDSMLGKYIRDSILYIRGLFAGYDLIPNEDFEYSGSLLRTTLEGLIKDDKVDIEGIIDCIHGSLGIMYRYTDRRAGLSSANQYAFIHHHVRDYFAAIWQVQLLKMVGEVIRTPEQFISAHKQGWLYPNYQGSLNRTYWKRDRRVLIGQILMEHRNRSVFDEELGCWLLPDEEYEEQSVLNRTVRFCSQLRDADINTDIILDNVIGTILLERGEVAGMDLSGLDLRRICLFNECCSKKGMDDYSYLTADFTGSWISEETFTSSRHKYDVSEVIYRQNRCFTHDGHTLKCHNLMTGRVILTVPISRREMEETNGITGKGKYRFHPYVSNDGKWLCYAHNNSDPKMQGCIELIKVDTGETKKLFPSVRSDCVTTFTFTEDSYHIIAVFDNSLYCIFDLESGKCSGETKIPAGGKPWTGAKLYCKAYGQPVFMSREEEGQWISVYLLTQDMLQDQELFSFISIKERPPLLAFSSAKGVFLFFDDDKDLLQAYDIETKQIRTVFKPSNSGIEPPYLLQIYREKQEECLLFYKYECYQIPFGRRARTGQYEVYRTEEAKMLSGNRDLPMNLVFGQFSGYCSHHVLLVDEVNNYEWDLFSNSVQLRYDPEQTGIENLLPDRMHRDIILLHADLGLSVFHELKFDRNIQLRMDGFLMGAHDYSSAAGKLAVLFAKPGEVAVKVVTIATGLTELVFSEHIPEEMMYREIDLCFDTEGKALLIQLPYGLYEYRTDIKTIQKLKFDLFREGELYLHAGYDSDYLNIITGYQITAEPFFKVWCSQFRRTGDSETGYSYSYYRTYHLPYTEEWQERFLWDRRQADIGVDGILEDEMSDYDLGISRQGNHLILSEWVEEHDVTIRQGILIPHVAKDMPLYLAGYNDMQKARKRWDADRADFRVDLGLGEFTDIDEDIDDIDCPEDETWPVRYYKDRIYGFSWSPDDEHRSSYRDAGFTYYDPESGACILMTDYEALELRYLKQIREESLEEAFERPLINPADPEFSWQRYGGWNADEVQPWTDVYNVYYTSTGEFGRISRFPEDWKYRTKQLIYSPGVCVKNCYFGNVRFEGEIKAVLRRSGAIV